MRFRSLPFCCRVLPAIWAACFSLTGIPAWAGDHALANTSASRHAAEELNLPPEGSAGYRLLFPDPTPSGKVRFKEGDIPEGRAPGSAARTEVKLAEKRAFGFLNGLPAAAVVLITDPGGSGTFYALALLCKEGEGWVHVDTLFLGDRVRLQDVAIEGNDIVVSMTVHGPGESMCCPTLQVRKHFTLSESRLVAVSEEPIEPIEPRD